MADLWTLDLTAAGSGLVNVEGLVGRRLLWERAAAKVDEIEDERCQSDDGFVFEVHVPLLFLYLSHHYNVHLFYISYQ